MRSFTKFIGNLTGVGVTLCAIGLFAMSLILWRLNASLPNYEHLANYAPPIMSRAHAGDGTLIGEYAQERRIFVPISFVPEHLIDAFLAAEDKNFYNHSGVDLAGITRAVVQNIKNVILGRRLEGASTITQQVAKNFLLTSDITLERKLKEALLALRLEQTFSKRQLLELYLNEIYLGLGTYGVAAASLNYFDKSLSELSIAEAAYLAALPKAPNNYHPFRQRQRAIARRNWVIERMLANGNITQAQADAAIAEDLVVADRASDLQRHASEYFVEEVRRRIYNSFGEKTLYGGGLSIRTTVNTNFQRIGKRALRDGLNAYDRRYGYRGPVARFEDLENWASRLTEISIPLDLAPWRLAVVLAVDGQSALIGLRPHFTRARRFADETQLGTITLKGVVWARAAASPENGYKVKGPKIRRVTDVLAVGDIIWASPTKAKDVYTLQQYPEVNGALVALNPHNGRVLAMIGGYSFSASEFNRATQANRQPGSAFKPFVYAAALDSGFTPASLVLDAPFVMDQGGEHGLWKPENYGRRFYGLSTLRLGMEKSRNLMTIRMAQEIGMPIITSYARRFDINDSMPRVLAMALGAGETSLIRLTTAYAMLVNGGKRVEPVFIDRVQNRLGKTLDRHDKRACVGCKADNWGANRENYAPPNLSDEREEVLSPQTAYQIVSMLEGAVKRGTGRSINSIGKPLAGKTGTTNDSRDAWFVGFSPDLAVGVYVGFDDNRPLGANESGGKVAAPIFKQFMQHALKEMQTTPFRIPPAVNLVRINAKTGKLARPDDDMVILEAFKPGTEPDAAGRQQAIIAGGNNNVSERPQLHETQTVGSGTGGLY